MEDHRLFLYLKYGASLIYPTNNLHRGEDLEKIFIQKHHIIRTYIATLILRVDIYYYIETHETIISFHSSLPNKNEI